MGSSISSQIEEMIEEKIKREVIHPSPCSMIHPNLKYTYAVRDATAYCYIEPEKVLCENTCVLYSFGNMERSCHPAVLYKVKSLADLFGIVFVLWDPPSYGHSRGLYTKDIHAYHAIESVFMEINDKFLSVYVWGRSIGTSFSAFIASQKVIQGLILESPLYSMIHIRFPAVSTWLRSVDQNKIDQMIEESHGFHEIPVIVMWMGKDTLISPESSHQIFKLLKDLNPRCSEVVFPDKGHNDTVTMDEYKKSIPSGFFCGRIS